MKSLLLHRVTKRFGGVSAVTDLSVEFREGEIAALIGPNGAGKTTVFNLIAGQLSPTEGDIFYDDVKISNEPPWRIARLGVGRMFQDVRVFRQLSVRDNVIVAFPGQTGENAFWSLSARSAVRAEERILNSRAEEILETVELLSHADVLARELSYGQQKLLALARLLATGANLLLMDEPTAGMAPGLAQKILHILNDAAAGGKTIVVIEHDINTIHRWVDVVHFMENGRLRLSDTPDVVFERPHVKQVYLGV